MKVLLITTCVLLFHMQSVRVSNARTARKPPSRNSLSLVADIIKECTKYEVSTTKQSFEESKETCNKIGGKMASSDLSNRDFAAKATEAVQTFRANNNSPIWIGVYAKENVDFGTKFYFLNGREMSDAKMSFKWRLGKGVPPFRNPQKHGSYKCGRIWTYKNDIFNYPCSSKNAVLCNVRDLTCFAKKMQEARE